MTQPWVNGVPAIISRQSSTVSPLDLPTLVNVPVTLEVLGNGLRCNVVYDDIAKLRGVKLEMPEVGGKNDFSFLRQFA